MRGKGNSFSYTVSVLRKSSGRGKSRKAGGLVTLQIPDDDITYESVEVNTYSFSLYLICLYLVVFKFRFMHIRLVLEADVI